MKMNALRPSRGPARLLWLYVWGPISLIMAFAPLAVLNLLQFPSLLLLPFSRDAYRAWNRKIASIIWGWWAFSIEKIDGMKLTITGDPLPDDENAIVVANHQSMADVVIVMCLAQRHGRVGDLRWLVKDIVKWVPGVGWGMVFLDCLFLKRNWADDEKNIKATFQRYNEHKSPLWLVSFPEGTRITPKKLEASRAYAAKVGLPPPSKVMLPRPKGFAASLQGLREHVTAVYSLTIAYPGKTAPGLVALIRGDVDEVKLNVRRIPVEAFGPGEDAASAWLMGEFREKDAWLASSAVTSL